MLLVIELDVVGDLEGSGGVGGNQLLDDVLRDEHVGADVAD